MYHVADIHLEGHFDGTLPENVIRFLVPDFGLDPVHVAAEDESVREELEERPAKRRKTNQSYKQEANYTGRSITISKVTIDAGFSHVPPHVLDALEASSSQPRKASGIRVVEPISEASVGSSSPTEFVIELGSFGTAQIQSNANVDARALTALKIYSGHPREYIVSKGNVSYEVLTTIHLEPLPTNPYNLRIEVRIQWNGTDVPRHLPLDRTNSVVLRDLFPDYGQISDGWTFQDFYDNVHVPSKTGPDAEKAAVLEVSGVGCKLYPFQRRTIRWLLGREGAHLDNRKTSSVVPISAQGLFDHVTALDGSDFYASPKLGMIVSHMDYLQDAQIQCDGGLLAEEMGLGKTVEILSLIHLHQRQTSSTAEDSSLTSSKATLIVSPVSIQRQWEAEIRMHSPHLQVMIYEGLRNIDTDNEEDEKELVELMRDFDIVLVSYAVLSAEVHYAAEDSDRKMRHAKRYRKRKSPLVQIDWWRCVLDECQMIEGGLNQAAQIAHQIPRRYSWAVSGTPMKKDATDLTHVMDFLRLRATNSPLWWSWSLVRNPSQPLSLVKPLLDQLFSGIALRHTKDQIKDELVLPPQKRLVLTMPFTPIEEQRYTDMFQEFCDDCGLSLDGASLTDQWNSESDRTLEKMRTWLARLRQTVLHPEVGERNRRALGRSEGPLRTVAEVLKVMADQNETALRAEERLLLASKLRRGQILEHAKNPQEALGLWTKVLTEARSSVEECRSELSKVATQQTETNGSMIKQESEHDSADEASSPSNLWRLRLRASLEVLHTATFFIANAHYQIKVNEDITKPDTDEFKAVEQQETKMYEEAKAIRKELLSEAHSRANVHMNTIKTRKATKIPKCDELVETGGLQSRHMIEKADDVFEIMNQQKEKMDSWREVIQKALLATLVDQEDEELQGDEYETSTKQQDEVYVYIEVLRALIADRHELLTGQRSGLIDFEMKRNMEAAKKDEGHSPPLMIKLLEERLAIRRKAYHSSFRSIITELRSLRSNLSSSSHGVKRVDVERTIVNNVLTSLQDQIYQQTKVHLELEKELELFMTTSNSRLDFYRQLQTISDSVAPFEAEFSDEERQRKLTEMLVNEVSIQDRLQRFQSRGRYLTHLHNENEAQAEPKHCIICRESIELGVLTSCGHQFCKDCLRVWWNTHRTCPVCKKSLSKNDFHQISYNPQVLSVQEEETNSKSPDPTTNSLPGSAAIYSGINSRMLAEIQTIDLPGSYGTKIDTLARHILYLRQSDPGAKSIIFSQFRDFLDILGRAFKRFRIGFASVDDHGRQAGSKRGSIASKIQATSEPSDKTTSKHDSGIERFIKDPGVECFFLHARAQATGLNLVNATHVFLCEPLINTALELQAIARVHRIGQHQPTTVYMYLVQGTVEQAIYDISVRRRLEHVGSLRDRAPKSRVNGRAAGTDSSNNASIGAENGSSSGVEPSSGALIEAGNGESVEAGNGVSVEAGSGESVEAGNGVSTAAGNMPANGVSNGHSQSKATRRKPQNKANSKQTSIFGGPPPKPEAAQTENDALETANSQELQRASLGRLLASGMSAGEFVPQNDLWECLFRVKVAGRASDEAQRAVAGFLGGEEAAERWRIVERGGRGGDETRRDEETSGRVDG